MSKDRRVRKYSNAGYSSMGGAPVVAQLAPDSTPTELNEDWYTERGRGKITGRKKKIQLHLWDSNPQPLAYMTRALPLVLRGSLKW